MCLTRGIICSTPPTAPFPLYLSAQESAELRNWIRGAEDGRRGRARGLKRRIGELLADDAELHLPISTAALEAARALPGQGWQKRISDTPRPSARQRRFFMTLRQKLYDAGRGCRTSPYDLQAHFHPAPATSWPDSAEPLRAALAELGNPASQAGSTPSKSILDERADELEIY